MTDYIATDTELTSIANAIRTKGGTSASLEFPDEFISAINAIGGGGEIHNQNKTVTPTESQQSVTADTGYTGLGIVTVNAISSSYVGSGVTRRSSTDLSVSGATVTAPSGYYESSASKAVASGTAGTPTATKGTVSNHSISITPSVTNTTGYITGSTKTGTAVTVSASELVSGSETKTENGTYDVTNLAELVVNVSGGGGGSIQTGTAQNVAATNSSLYFFNLQGTPTSFAICSEHDISTSGSVTAAGVVYDGTSIHTTTAGSGGTAYDSSDITFSYSGGTLSLTSDDLAFSTSGYYKLVYTYNGSSSDIHTANVQVGSGATSITFPVTGRPAYWSCIFKSNFSTSSGYQRVMEVVNDGSSIYGMAMDSSAKAQTSWTESYSGENLTINSQGTNNGGYFHQPGYYQLTYYVDSSAPSYQTKSAYATTTAQTITPDSGYDALESVSIGAISQTNLIADNIKSGTTISISNGSTNLWSVLGTYTGGGGGTLTVATKKLTHTSTGQTLSFTSLSGQPKYWFLRTTTNVSSSGSTTYYYVTDCFYDGTNINGNTFRIGSTRRVQNITSGISQSYSSGTLTITAGSSSTATPGQFYGASNFGYELVYIY